ncbi:nitric oxide synthase oxygenase [Nostoc sp.]|uniref:nitric oxide synthase oxygenase n=1 Tax=Nostoc sp. TaxID=1180 RepID=UPI002FFC3912
MVNILGDPANLELTNAIIKFGWQSPETPTAYDMALVIEAVGQQPKIYHWNKDEVLEVEIEHPRIFVSA